ncbi:dienelactone hydrolase family protein [Thalassotalea nanhaiensis]|uniref:Dienelactone hydrolase family protein n=1 Tax=Thalassotalea nanhaiensis TaxID=3065648 RepID=A0ABY9TI66_9GAMM|nr:dienelactone hydrolase family protein [Colwelliaceae bacterium SQ345]
MKFAYKLNLIFVLIILNLSNISNAQPIGEFPASTTELTFNAAGKRMTGFIYQAEGKGPHPSVLLLHGYPGNEKNLDVAQALRSNGWNVLFFHYRGAWGSEGEFSFLNAEQDVQTVLQYMSDKNNAAKLRIDSNLISIVGHSMGGHMAMAGIFDNQSVNCAIAYDGANLGVSDVGLIKDPETTVPWKEYSDTLFMLNGWSGDRAEKELKEYGKALNLVRRVNSLNGRPVLLVAADSDHSFNADRTELINTTLSFLNSNCKGK